MLNTVRNARILLDHGFTSAYSAGSLGKTIEMSLKSHIDSGGVPGPRLVPSTLEREPPNESAFLEASSVEEHGVGLDAIRAFVKASAQRGAKVVKFLLSGESALKPGASMQLLYTEEEVRAAGEQARESSVWLSGHAHAAEAIKMGVRHGFRMYIIAPMPTPKRSTCWWRNGDTSSWAPPSESYKQRSMPYHPRILI